MPETAIIGMPALVALFKMPPRPNATTIVRGAHHVRHVQKGVIGIQNRLRLVDINSSHTRPAGFQRRALLDQAGTAGVHQQGMFLHHREIIGAHDAARFGMEPDVQGYHIAV